MMQVREANGVAQAAAQWRPLLWAPGYWISSSGDVKRYGRTLKPTQRRGYLRVWLMDHNGDKRMHGVHVLVLETFVSQRPSPRHHAAHTPLNDKSCNCLDNLAWKLPEDNEADKRQHGTQPRGGRNWRPNRARIERVRQ